MKKYNITEAQTPTVFSHKPKKFEKRDMCLLKFWWENTNRSTSAVDPKNLWE